MLTPSPHKEVMSDANKTSYTIKFSASDLDEDGYVVVTGTLNTHLPMPDPRIRNPSSEGSKRSGLTKREPVPGSAPRVQARAAGARRSRIRRFMSLALASSGQLSSGQVLLGNPGSPAPSPSVSVHRSQRSPASSPDALRTRRSPA